MTVRLDQTARDLRVLELRARRAMADAARGRRRRLRRKVPMQQLPRGEQLRFQRAILAHLAEVEAIIEEEFFPIIDRVVAQTRQTDPSARTDAPADDLDDAFTAVGRRIGTLGRRAPVIAGEMVTGVTAFNRRQIDRQLLATIGTELPPTEAFLANSTAVAVRENVSRITSLATANNQEAMNEIQRLLRQGAPPREIRRAVQARFKVNRNRARLIARDQTNKLNGELTRMRQTSAGITDYIWRTVGDDDVREAHEELDGQRFSWARGSPEGHPGEPINCRCTAEPVVDELREAL